MYIKKIDEKAEKTKQKTEEYFNKTLRTFESWKKFEVRIDGFATNLDNVIKANSDIKEEVKRDFKGIKKKLIM